MALQFIIGNGGSGKSTYLYNRVIEESMKQPDKNFLFIVPEQFTMQTQKEFVKRHPRGGILNIDVLSFQRLAYRVFEQVGGFLVPVLDDVGKSLVLRKIAQDKENELVLLRSSLKKNGTIEELKSVLSEFIQYQVTSAQLTQLADHAKNPGLSCKLRDLGVLYDGFFQYLEEKYITSEQVLQVLCRVIDQCKFVKDSVIVLDGFTGFTPLQKELLHHLMKLSEKMMVALTMDKESAGRGVLPEHELFALSAKTMDTLRRIAGEERVEVEETVYFASGGKSRWSQAPALQHLEKHLFRQNSQAYTDEDAKKQLRILEAGNPIEELNFVASEIHKLVREKGYTYKQIAVVSGDMETYGAYMERVFSQYEIPCFLDNTTRLLMNPMIDTIRSLLMMVTENLSYESVFRCLRCGLSGFSESEVDRLENYVIAFGVRGMSMWKETWVRTTKEMAPEDLQSLNELREAFVEDVAPFVEVCKQADTTVKEKTVALYEFLVSKQLQEELTLCAAAFEQEGLLTKEKEYSQIYELVINLLDQYVELLGEEKVTAKEYEELLEAGLSTPKIGVLPPGTDYVVAGDIERSRLTDIQVLFFVGVNEGIVPKAPKVGGVLSDLERERLLEADVELAPTQRENFFIQKFYLYLLVTKAAKNLYVSYSTSQVTGEVLRPSYFIQSLRKLFPEISVEKPGETKSIQKMETKKEVLDYFRAGLEKGDTKKQQLYQAFSKNESTKDALMQMEKARGFQRVENGIGEKLAGELYGGLSHVSVTRLEKFSACPYAHFLQYGLKLRERDIYEFSPVDSGNVFHDALEQYANALAKKGMTMAAEFGEEQRRLAEDCLEESLVRMGGERLLYTARGQYHVTRMKRLMERTVWALGLQLRRGSFETANFELDFSAQGGIYPVELFEGEKQMFLGGRIDRMDVLQEEDKRYVRIIDYKSGKQEFSLLKFYHGLQLQLVVYLQAAMSMEKKMYQDKQIIPAGIFYYRMEDPLLEGKLGETDIERQERVLRKLRLDGYVNENDGIINKMDKTVERTSSVIPATLNKDGSLSKSRSKTATTKQMELLMDYNDSTLQKLGEKMYGGNTSISPCLLEKESACSYCKFEAVCGFDKKLSCYRYRNLRKLKNDEIWEKMEESVWKENGQ